MRIKKVVQFLGPQVTRLLIFGVAIGVVLFIVELGFAYSIQAFLGFLGHTNSFSESLPKWIPTKNFHSVIAFILVIGFVRGLIQWAQVYMQTASNEYIKYQQRSRILRWAFTSESVSTTTATSLFSERTVASGAAILSLQSATMQLTTVFFLSAGLLYLSPLLTLAIGLGLGIFFLPMKALDRKIELAGMSLAREWDHANGRLIMSIKNLLLMRIYGTQEEEFHATQGHMDQYLKHNMTFATLAGLKFAFPQVIGVTLICLITALDSSRLHLAGGLLVSYFYLFVRVTQNFSELIKNGANFNLYRPQLEILANWWEKHSYDGLSEKNITIPTQRNIAFNTPTGWKLSNVSFSYGNDHKDIFSNFNLELLPGKLSVVIGASGTGKSTLVNILLGVSEGQEGQVEITADSESFPLGEVRSSLLHQIGFVGAESFLLEGTIKENLMYGARKPISEEELNTALKKAECQFVFDLPLGVDHRLTEQGQGLSAGQKQRISLARALLRNPKALILDEATANLDLATEDRLVETLSKLKGQMTIVAITHRHALLKVADQVIELS